MVQQAIENLSSLRELHENADIRQRRKIIGSISPKNSFFEGMNYRTAQVNEAIRLILNVEKAFREIKNGQTDKNFDLSRKVTRPGFEPGHTDPESVVLPLYYRAIFEAANIQRPSKIKIRIVKIDKK